MSGIPTNRSGGCRTRIRVSCLNAARRYEKTLRTMLSHGGAGVRGLGGWGGPLLGGALGGVLGCSSEPSRPAGTGSLAGQVVVSGPLRRASVSVDQLDY